MRLVALTCEVMARSVYYAAAQSPNVVDVRLNRRGLHDNPPELRRVLQDEIDDVGAPHDAIVLAYGLCGGSAAGIVAGNVPVVVPRAHDCITLFLGSRDEYQSQTLKNPGTYWYVQDYMERGTDDGAFAGLGANTDEAITKTREEYVDKYGEDNAEYLMEVTGAWRDHYNRAVFIDMGIGDPEKTRAMAEAEARAREWTFDPLNGSYVITKRLIDGDWPDEDYLILQPGERLEMSHDEAIIKAVPTDG
jgi:hypothetical protein